MMKNKTILEIFQKTSTFKLHQFSQPQLKMAVKTLYKTEKICQVARKTWKKDRYKQQLKGIKNCLGNFQLHRLRQSHIQQVITK